MARLAYNSEHLKKKIKGIRLARVIWWNCEAREQAWSVSNPSCHLLGPIISTLPGCRFLNHRIFSALSMILI